MSNCKRCREPIEDRHYVKCCLCRFKNMMSQRKRRGKDNERDEQEGIEFDHISDHMIELHTKIIDKINSHRSYDKNRNFYYEQDFIDFEDIFMKICKQKGKCFYCKTKLKLINYKPYQGNQFSIDRLNSETSHTRINTVVSCLNCNVKKGKTSPHQYIKTMNYVQL